MASTSTSTSTSLQSEVRKPKCCSCNWINARCKSCVCVKANRSCTNCQPIKRGGCANSNRSAALSPSLSRHHGSTSATSACSRPLSPGTVASPVISYSQPSPHSLIHSAHQPQPRVSPQPPSPSLHVSLSSANLSLPPPVFISDPPQPISTSPHCGNPLPVSSNLHVPVLGQKDPPVPNDQDPCAFAASMQPSLLAFNQDIAACRSPCTVPGCQARIAPSMWHSHMQQHAHGILSGEVPAS